MSSRTVAPSVEHILKNNILIFGVSPRDNDYALIISKLEREGFTLSDTQKKKLMQCTPAESITRARRTLRPKYPGSNAVEQKRFERFKEELDEYGNRVMVRYYE